MATKGKCSVGHLSSMFSVVVLNFRQTLELQRTMVFNAIFNNISVILWQLVLLVKEAGVPLENHRPAESHWQTSSHVVSVLFTEGDQNSPLQWWHGLAPLMEIDPQKTRLLVCVDLSIQFSSTCYLVIFTRLFYLSNVFVFAYPTLNNFYSSTKDKLLCVKKMLYNYIVACHIF